MCNRPGHWVLASALLLGACSGDDRPRFSTNAPSQPPLFSEIAAEASLDYRWGYKDGTHLDEIHRFCGGVAAGDVDLDGLVDLFVVRGNIGAHLLFRNLGNNRFEEIASSAGIDIQSHRGCGPAFADIDGDGDLDLFVGGIGGERSYLLINQFKEGGALSFVDKTTAYGLDQISAASNVSSSFGDYDQDGWLDLFIAHWGTPKNTPRQSLWKNIGGESFENASGASRVDALLKRQPLAVAVKGPDTDYSFLASFADVSNDGRPDLLVVSDFRTSQVLINRGDGSFFDSTTGIIKDENGMGSAIGDIDNDGDLDWFVSAIFSSILPGNRFYRNQQTRADGSVEFSDETESLGVADGHWGWGACMADFNLDGILDIFHVNGWDSNIFGNDYRRTRSRLYLSTGELLDGGLPRLVDMSNVSGINHDTQGRAVVCFDSDNDGDVDILAVNNDRPAAHLYRNDSTAEKNFLSVRLRGLPPNTAAAGARIYVTTGETQQMREITIGSNFTSQNPLRQYFGLGTNDTVDTLRVDWRDGRVTTMNNVSAGQRLSIDHPGRAADGAN